MCSRPPDDGRRRSATSKPPAERSRKWQPVTAAWSRGMAQIQERIAAVDINLWDAYSSDPAKYAAASRELATEAYEICDKLSLVQSLRHEQASGLRHVQFRPGRMPGGGWPGPDLALILKAEQVWANMLREAPTNPMARGYLVVVRRRLAEELAAAAAATRRRLVLPIR